MNQTRYVLATLLLCLCAAAQAAIGEPPEVLLRDLEGAEPRTVESGYEAADDFTFELDLRGGVVHSVTGNASLNPENVAFMARLIAAATGYGDSIEGPVSAFLGDRIGGLAGAGEATVAVEAFWLVLNVSGAGEPYQVSFRLELQEVEAEQFPEPRHVLGPRDARFVVREFSDFQCPYCAIFARQTLPLIKAELLARGDVRFEYHHFPLMSIHPNAVPAAEAAECVTSNNSPDDFWEYHDALFRTQADWQGLRQPIPYFVELARELGLDTAGVEECVEQGQQSETVRASYETAAGVLRLSGTPTVFLNGYKVGAPNDLRAYRDLIELVTAFSTGE